MKLTTTFWSLVIILIFGNSTLQTTSDFSNQKTIIEYSGQVTGFPVKDKVTYEYQPSTNNQLRWYQTLSRENFNPHHTTFSHAGQVLPNGSTAFDIGCVLHPQNFYGIEHTTVTQTGDLFDYPSSMTVGTQLKDLEGNITISNNDNFSKVLNIKITDREIVKKETITIGTKNYDTFLLKYHIKNTKSFNGQWFETEESDIKEWIVPNIGVLKRIDNSQILLSNNSNEESVINTEFTILATSIKQIPK